MTSMGTVLRRSLMLWSRVSFWETS
ncbi:MAG: hypothetical protein JWR57_412, partial [Mycetocola sp.]|nr:hypothetical protein [Mycetocola sp.]